MAEKGELRAVATNRRARHEYEILDTLEAGLALLGPEVKSLRAGRANLGEGYAVIRRGEAFLRGVHISPYAEAGRENPEPRRERKLLLHRREIDRLAGRLGERGLTLIPLRIYFRNGRAKVEIALARGRRKADRREAIREREVQREIDRRLRRSARGGR